MKHTVIKRNRLRLLLASAGGLALILAQNTARPGVVYMSNAVNSTIERFGSGGFGSLFADTNLDIPEGMAFDSAGNLYVANSHGNTIEKFTPGGGGSVFASTGLNRPVGLAFDTAGNLYAANYSGYTIERFTPDGTGSVFASTGLNGTYGIAFDNAGNLYVANANDDPGSVEVFTPGGSGSVFAHTETGGGPAFLAVTTDAGKPFLPLAIRPRLDFIPPFTSSQFGLRVTGAPGSNYTIQATIGLTPASPNWTNLVTSNSATGVFDFADTQATNPAEFYRAVGQ